MTLERKDAIHNKRVFDNLSKAYRGFGRQINKTTMLGVHDTAKRILKTAKQNAPVDTGALRRSGRIRKLKNSVKVTFGGSSIPRNVTYAEFVEEGTFSRPPTYFLKRAIKAHMGNLSKDVTKRVSRSWIVYAKIGTTRG